MDRVSTEPRPFRMAASLLAGCALAGLLSGLTTLAQDDAGARPNDAAAADAVARGTVISRVYDVRDLVLGIKDYPFRGTMMPARQSPPTTPFVGGRGGASAAAPAAATQAQAEAERRETTVERLDTLVQLITETVAPDSWRDAGGTFGAIRSMNGMLIVTQTPENHTMLQNLLSQFRETRGKMVRVRAHWLLMSPADAEKVFAPGDGGGGGSGKGAGGGGGAGQPAPSALVPVDPAALRNLPPSAVHYHAQTIGFNNQTVHVVSGPARTVVTDVDAQVGTGAVAFDPVVEFVRSGLVLEVTPLVAAGNNEYATLDLYSAFVDAAREHAPIPVRAFAATRPAGTAGAEPGAAAETGMTKADGVIDRLSTTMQELRTTIQIPLNRPVLVGGMTLDPAVAGQPSPQLYLVIEVVASE